MRRMMASPRRPTRTPAVIRGRAGGAARRRLRRQRPGQCGPGPAALTAPSLGEPSREVLLETGLLAPAVAELVATGAVVQGTRLSSRTTIAEPRR